MAFDPRTLWLKVSQKTAILGYVFKPSMRHLKKGTIFRLLEMPVGSVRAVATETMARRFAVGLLSTPLKLEEMIPLDTVME